MGLNYLFNLLVPSCKNHQINIYKVITRQSIKKLKQQTKDLFNNLLISQDHSYLGTKDITQNGIILEFKAPKSGIKANLAREAKMALQQIKNLCKNNFTI